MLEEMIEDLLTEISILDKQLFEIVTKNYKMYSISDDAEYYAIFEKRIAIQKQVDKYITLI